MIASFLITFREILEAALIVATIIGILYKLQFKQAIKAVWLGVFLSIALSIGLLLLGSILGLQVRTIFEKYEALFEGVVMIISALFITWAVFYLHKTFALYKLQFLVKIKSTIKQNQLWAIFALVFTAVFREGLEIVLFLSTVYFSSKPAEIWVGFFLGFISASTLALLLFTTSVRLPVYQTFKATSILLIFFAAGMLAHGFHELMEAGVLPNLSQLPTLSLLFLPEKSTLFGGVIRSLFGLTRYMHSLELLLWSTYALFMWHKVILKRS